MPVFIYPRILVGGNGAIGLCPWTLDVSFTILTAAAQLLYTGIRLWCGQLAQGGGIAADAD